VSGPTGEVRRGSPKINAIALLYGFLAMIAGTFVCYTPETARDHGSG